jgi:dolichol-phosphate mannosyltransferase
MINTYIYFINSIYLRILTLNINQKSKGSILIPTLNERFSISALIIEINQILIDYDISQIEIVVVDDSSNDGTIEIINTLKECYNNITLLKGNETGFAASLYLGLYYILHLTKSDFIITMDADLSHSPSAIPKMIYFYTEYNIDLIIGSRYINGGRTINQNFQERLFSNIANSFIHRYIFNDAIDCTSGYRLYSTKVLKELNLLPQYNKGYVFQVQILAELSQLNRTVMEIPIVYKNRVFGKSKFHFYHTIETVLQLFKLALQNRHQSV